MKIQNTHEKIDMNLILSTFMVLSNQSQQFNKNYCNLYKQRFTFIKLYLVVGRKQKS